MALTSLQLNYLLASWCDSVGVAYGLMAPVGTDGNPDVNNLLQNPNPTTTIENINDIVQSISAGVHMVMTTAAGNPSFVTVIPSFLGSFGTDHPAFLIGGVPQSKIYVGTYLAILTNGEGVSWPPLSKPYQFSWAYEAARGNIPKTSLNDPNHPNYPEVYMNPTPFSPRTVNIGFDSAKAACVAAGAGWHMLTNWEYGAIQQALSGPYGVQNMAGPAFFWVDGLWCPNCSGGQIMTPVDNDFISLNTIWSESGVSIGDMLPLCYGWRENLPGSILTISYSCDYGPNSPKAAMGGVFRKLEASIESNPDILPSGWAANRENRTKNSFCTSHGYISDPNAEMVAFRGSDGTAAPGNLCMISKFATMGSNLGFRTAFIGTP